MRNWQHRDWNAGKLSGIKPLVTLPATLPQIILDWFAARDWTPRRHQLEMLEAASEGRHALLVAATGAGKTLAGFLPTLAELIEDMRSPAQAGVQTRSSNPSLGTGSQPALGNTLTPVSGLHTLYISPLKALAVDVRRGLPAGLPASRRR